jgi:Fe2+ transport system protein B
MSPGLSPPCEVCPANRNARLVKLGLNTTSVDYVLALAGNPNVGKSTVFNQLTGLRQHTGNWPGKTVARAEGAFSYSGKRYKMVDLPGTYSLLSTSTDEQIARDFILFGQPDVTVIVADATRLERNLNLVLQVLGITERAVVCVNLADEAKRNGITIDLRTLVRELGVPVVMAAARSGEGMADLLQSIAQVATGAFVCRPRRIWTASPNIKAAVDQLATLLEKEFLGLSNARWVALRLLEGDQHIIDAVRSGELGELSRSSEPTTENGAEVVSHESVNVTPP